MSAFAAIDPAEIALNRFGLGAGSDERPTDPPKWLLAQFDSFVAAPAALAPLPDGRELYRQYRAIRLAQFAANKADGKDGSANAAAMAALRDFNALAFTVADSYRRHVVARTQVAIETETPFVERLVHFWSNHFAISVDAPPIMGFAGGFERDAIRPHVLGRFKDMLRAVEQHPAMLQYLNQDQSIGPDSPAGVRARNNPRRPGLNENLAREIMELHTLGVRSGYTQADVTELARALTGWMTNGPDAQSSGVFRFEPDKHQPGARTILGRTYRAGGEEQALAILSDLADAPATARFVATKLARHFAGDTPPPAMVARLSAAFSSSGGDLPTVYRALVDSPEAWNPAPVKIKTPWEWVVSAMRGFGTMPGEIDTSDLCGKLGQQVWKPGSPAGWDDLAATWLSTGALLRKIETAPQLAGAARRGPPGLEALARRMLPSSLDIDSAATIARADSVPTGMSLLVLSPAFLRR